MIDSITRITLNLQETNTMVSIRAKRGDTGRKLLIHLSDGSIPYHISDECYATFTAKKADGTKINNPCSIENNVIIYEFTEQTCTAVGTMKAEIRLYGSDDKMITSACFLVNVYDTVFRDGDEVDSESEMNTLDDLILRANAFLNETGKLLRWQGNWDSETEYEANDLVLHEEVLYVAEEAIAAGTVPGSEEITAWVPIAGMGTGSGGEVVGIASVTQTTTTSISEGVNVVTVTLTDGTESKIQIRNGRAGVSIQGPAGPAGPAGPIGPIGFRGPTGATGPQGPAGPAGEDYVLTDDDKAEIAEMAAEMVEVPDSGGNVENGEDGFSPIAKVEQTATGAVISITDKGGTTTATITNGKDGKDGADGQPGKDGSDGAPGEKGDKGDKGDPGEPGQKGEQGEQGIPGEKGDKGDTGAKGDKGDPGNSGVYILADGETVEDAPADANVIIDPNGSSDSSGSGDYEVGTGGSASQPSSGAVAGVNGVESWTLAKTVTTTEDALSVKIDLDDKYNEVFVYTQLAARVKLKAQIACLTHFGEKRCELSPVVNASEQVYNILAINPLPHETSVGFIAGGGNVLSKVIQAKYATTGSYVELISYDNTTVIAANSVIEVYVR